MQFSELNLHPDIQRGITDAGFHTCTPVQAEAFSFVLGGRDLFAQSQTGTGKTAAFLIGLFHNMLLEKRGQALIIAPTRELAIQILEEAELLGRYLDLKMGSFYGGVGYHQQEKLLREGVDILIGTPGRLIDFNQSGKIDFRAIGYLVLDEADRLFDLGFYPDIRKMMKRMRAPVDRQTMLFSATLDTRARQLAYEFMNDPGVIEIEPEDITAEKIEQRLYHVGTDEKMSVALGILKNEKPRNVLIFTNMKSTAEEVAMRFQLNDIPCEYLIGDLPQSKRLKRIERFKQGKTQILIATDVAARGIHVDDLDMVLNWDVPQHAENYVHRIGRTARAGNTGKAITLSCEEYVFGLSAIEKYIKLKIPVAHLDDADFVEDKSSHLSKRQLKYAAEKRKRGQQSSGGQQKSSRSKSRNRSKPKQRTRSDTVSQQSTSQRPDKKQSSQKIHRRNENKRERPNAQSPEHPVHPRAQEKRKKSFLNRLISFFR